MKNPSFFKLICLFCTGILVIAGYQLLPEKGDLHAQVEKQTISAFTRGFHDVEKGKPGETLPDVMLMSREGRAVDFKALGKGRISIVNFWASWCAPCLEEMPSLARLQQANADIMVIPVSLDMQKTLPELSQIFKPDDLRDLRWFYDSGGVLRKHLSLTVYPTTYILDKKGDVLYKLQGPNDWSSREALNFMRILSAKY